MVKLAMLGNCQVQTLAVLAPLMVDGAEVTIFDFSSTSSRDENNRRAFADRLDDYDWVLTQPTHLSHTSLADLRERFPGKTCAIGNFYFRGLFPDSCYVGSFEQRMQRPTPVHSIIILDAFLCGLSPAEAAQSFTIDNYQRLGLLDAWASSMEEMRRRDQESAVDVPAAELMEQACRAHPAFLTMNHPTITFLGDYLSHVFHALGLRHTRVDTSKIPDPLAAYDTTPIDDVVAEHYGLPYRTSQRWMLAPLGRRYADKEEMADRFYGVYSSAGRDALAINSPADLRRRYEADPQLTHLMSGGAMVAGSAAPKPRAWVPSRADVGRYTLMEAVNLIEEIRSISHRLHSYAEVSDPKIERLVHQLTHRGELVDDLVYVSDQSRHTLRALRLLKRFAAIQTTLLVVLVVLVCMFMSLRLR